MPLKRTLNKRQLARLLLALGLCYFLYLFSYDYGQSVFKPEMNSFKAELGRQKEEILQLRREVERLQRPSAGAAFEKSPPAPKQTVHQAGLKPLTLRADASETLFNHQLSLVLLEHSQLDRSALIQFNFIRESRVMTSKIPLGGAFKFELAGQEKLLILEKLQPDSVVIKIVNI